MSSLQLNRFIERVENADPFPRSGYVTNLLGIIVEGSCPHAAVGSICEIYSLNNKESCTAEVVGLKDERVILMPLGEPRGIGIGSRIRLRKRSATTLLGPDLLGRVLDGLGRPLDGRPLPDCDEEFSIYASPLNPLRRQRIHEPLDVGVRAVNALLTIGKGQRMGIMAGSGVGKSVLLGMMARNTSADVNVIALVGERGREVREFIERDLGPEGLKRSILVVATSDVPPLIRMRAAYLATTIAEYFRKAGKNVLLMMDSVTRFAMAQREVGLSAGEPPTTKGYPPSVFTTLPRLFERVGTLSRGGSITGIYTVLTEADDINDPVADSVRAIVDGHIVLSRRIAARNHYPAIDIPYSSSRVMTDVATKEHMQAAAKLKSILATYNEAEDLINIGAYAKGSNQEIDQAIELISPIRQFLRQGVDDQFNFAKSIQDLQSLFEKKESPQEKAKGAKK